MGARTKQLVRGRGVRMLESSRLEAWPELELWRGLWWLAFRPHQMIDPLCLLLLLPNCKDGNDNDTGATQNDVPRNERMVPSPLHPSSFGAAPGKDDKRRTPPPPPDENGRRGWIGGSAVLDQCQFDVS